MCANLILNAFHYDVILLEICLIRRSSLTQLPNTITLSGIRMSLLPRVHSHWLFDDKTITDQLSDVLPRVRIGDLADFVGVQPDLLLAALQDARGEPLLQLQRTHPTMRGVFEF